MALSYNGWPASPDPRAIGINTEWEPIPGHRFPGGVKSGAVEKVLTYVVRQLDARVEPIDRDAIKDEWGWFYKPSANSPDTLSCHSSGTAFDYNATRHPNGVRGTFTAAQVAEIREIQSEVLHVVRWLGDATRVADEMHFEIDGTPDEVAAAAQWLTRTEENFLSALTPAEQREVLEHLRHLDPWEPERLNSRGERDPQGKLAARSLRWAAESLNKLRRL